MDFIDQVVNLEFMCQGGKKTASIDLQAICLPMTTGIAIGSKETKAKLQGQPRSAAICPCWPGFLS
jgi:hypothetical protein